VCDPEQGPRAHVGDRAPERAFNLENDRLHHVIEPAHVSYGSIVLNALSE
jgi:hypothetical protein